jgi:hypothetical protein
LPTGTRFSTEQETEQEWQPTHRRRSMTMAYRGWLPPARAVAAVSALRAGTPAQASLRNFLLSMTPPNALARVYPENATKS